MFCTAAAGDRKTGGFYRWRTCGDGVHDPDSLDERRTETLLKMRERTGRGRKRQWHTRARCPRVIGNFAVYLSVGGTLFDTTAVRTEIKHDRKNTTASSEILRTHTKPNDNDRGGGGGGSSSYLRRNNGGAWRRTTRNFGRRHDGRAHVHAKRTATTAGCHVQVKHARLRRKSKNRRRRPNTDHWLAQNRCGTSLAWKTMMMRHVRLPGRNAVRMHETEG